MFASLPAAFARTVDGVIVAATATLSLACSSDVSETRNPIQSTLIPDGATSTPIRRGQPDVLLLVEDAPADGLYRTLSNTGTAAVRVRVASENGGVLTAAAQRSGQGNAIRTPRFSAKAGAPRAVVQITSTGATDPLNPHARRFSFGADFTLDEPSLSSVTGSTDNGNNLVQRGLRGAAGKYKLQLDGDSATCQIRGDIGEVVVSSTVIIQSDRWYRAQCQRRTTSVSISVTHWWIDGSAHTVTDTQAGRTGDMTPDQASLPLSVGGKVQPADEVDPSADQFNGRIDNVVLRIG